MNLFGYPIEIWVAAFISVLVKLKSSKHLTLLGSIVTISVALASGVILYQPMLVLLNLSSTWAVPVSIMIALTAENFMKSLVELSADKDWLREWLKFLITRRYEDKK